MPFQDNDEHISSGDSSKNVNDKTLERSMDMLALGPGL